MRNQLKHRQSMQISITLFTLTLADQLANSFLKAAVY